MATYSKAPSFKNQPPFSVIEQIAARLVTLGPNGDIFVSGSCVRIARNLYLTAGHVMLDFLDRFGHNGAETNFTTWAIHVRPGPEYSIWQVNRLWISPHSDLAVFHTIPYNDIAGVETDIPSVGLDLTPPPTGSRIVGFGHHSPSGCMKVGSNGTKHIEVNTNGAATVGEVKEIHPIRRDHIRLKFPCFRVNARFDGGMSGGPVFSDNGKVCGVIVSDLPPSNEAEEHSSYAATLWPLMGIAVDISPSPSSVLSQPYPLIELAKQQVIHVAGWEKVSVRTTITTGLYEVTLHEHLAV